MNSEIIVADTVLLTGASGFLGGHVALQLLKAGYAVRGSVRNLSKADKVAAMLERSGASVSQLDFVALELTSDDGWQEAARGCSYLIHTASPVTLAPPKNPDDVIIPAVEGTRRAVEAALHHGAERIVLTSSTSAIQHGHADPHRRLTEADWSVVPSKYTSAYAASKTLAERQAWSLVDAAGRKEALSVINPAVMLGPLLDDNEPGSAALVRRLLDGKMPVTPRLAFAIVDVRDVAALHVDALSNPDAAGQRCIAAVETLYMNELGRRLKRSFPDRRIPTRNIFDWVVRLLSRFDDDISDAAISLGRPRNVDGRRGAERLGRPMIGAADAATATGRSLIELGLP